MSKLHSGSWFRIGELLDFLFTGKDRRQGCQLGSIILNFVYARALKRLETQILIEDILTHIPVDNGAAPWETKIQDKAALPSHTLFDITYVDDEDIMLAANSARELDYAIERLLHCFEKSIFCF